MKPYSETSGAAVPRPTAPARPADTQSLMAATRSAFFTQLLAHRERRRMARTARPSVAVPQHAA